MVNVDNHWRERDASCYFFIDTSIYIFQLFASFSYFSLSIRGYIESKIALCHADTSQGGIAILYKRAVHRSVVSTANGKVSFSPVASQILKTTDSKAREATGRRKSIGEEGSDPQARENVQVQQISSTIASLWNKRLSKFSRVVILCPLVNSVHLCFLNLFL